MQQQSSFSCGILFRKCKLIVGGKGSERPQRYPRQSISTLYNRRVFGLACILALALIVSLPYAGLAMEYGATGPFRVEVKTFENSIWPQRDGGVPVTVLLPAQRNGAVPVVFFSHGLGATSWFSYRSLLRHVTSWGVAVVFSPYPPSSNWSNQYSILWNGFKRAAELYAADFDLSRVGFAGHSYGGGATPNMALRARKAGWGTQGMFMFIMAPAPASGVSTTALKSLSQVNLIMQVYENDTICPHSWAQSTYQKVGTLDKAYYYVHGANHFTPTELRVDDFDRLAIWKPLDALMDYTFDLDTPDEGMLYALYGEGDYYNTDVSGPHVGE